MAKRKCADLGEHIDHIAAEKLKRDSYVDDTLTGGTREEVERFRGPKGEDDQYQGTMPQILKLGGLKIKAMITSKHLHFGHANVANSKINDCKSHCVQR